MIILRDKVRNEEGMIKKEKKLSEECMSNVALLFLIIF